MEVEGQKVLATEKVRRRTSKWDVEAERHLDAEIRIENALPERVDDTSTKFIEPNFTKPSLSMSIYGSEIEQSANKSGKVTDINSMHSYALFEMSQNPKQIDLEADSKDGLKKPDCELVCLEQTMEECVENQPGKLSDNNLKHSSVLCELPQNLMQIDPEGNCKDGGKMQDWEHVCQVQTMAGCVENQFGKVSDKMSQNPKQIDLEDDCKDGFKEHVSQEQTMSKYVENHEKSLKRACEMSPGSGVRHQGIHNISPIDARNISDRKRSRSRSRSMSRSRSRSRSRSLPYDSRSRSRSWSRTKSPSYVHKQGSERWTDTSRMRRMVSPCRDFAAGRCTRGGSCRYLHESGGMKQIDRHYNSGSTDGKGNRIEKINSSRENFSRRHDPYEDGWDNKEPHRGYRSANRCFNFTKGRCLKGTSCKYVHDDGPSDAGWNARDESRERVNDRWGGNGSSASFGNRLERLHVSQVPCKFFLENCCRNGERCKFLHQVKPVNIHTDSSVESELHNQSTHFAPPLPLNGQMQQIMNSHPQNLQNQFPAFHQPPNSHYFNASMQNQHSHPLCYELNQQNLGQVQQLMQPHNESNYNPNGTIQQSFPPIPNTQGQPNFNVSVPIQQNLASHVGSSHQDIIVSSHIPDVQNHLVTPLPPSNPQIFNLDEKNNQLTENNQTSVQQHTSHQGATSSEAKPSQINSDDPISNKVVTSEQAAKIVGLSASLAQFFGTAALNPQPATGMTPQPFLNPGSLGPFMTTVAPLMTQVDSSQTNLVCSAPLEEKPHIQPIDSSTGRELKKTETTQISKQQSAQFPNDDGKKIKEAKDIRMFKCALIEFVKDILKPKWKEGQLSKEAHKTIVKKVVEKVSGSLQGPNVPQTQEKVDLYLLASKPKLSKLVQAYVEKFVKI